MSAKDIQIGGKHYTDLDIEPWDAQLAWMGPEGFVSFLRGCAIKRLGRYDKKDDPIVELKKARHELDRAIEVMEEFSLGRIKAKRKVAKKKVTKKKVAKKKIVRKKSGSTDMFEDKHRKVVK